MDKIQTAYKTSENFYDDALTQNKWWSKLYMNLFWRVNDNEIARKVLDYIPENLDGGLLDIPVGTGVFTASAYAKIPKSRITCIDYSDAMLKKASALFNQHSLSNVKCLQGDVGDLQFPENKFDIVLSMNGFHAFPDKEKAFQETARVLKKGGLFIGCFYIKGEYKPSDFVVNAVLSKKGWFTPPFQTLTGLKDILNSLYSNVEVFNENAMA